MSAVDDILGQIPLGQLAAQLGTDEQTAEAATRSALPALLGGLQANAQDPAGEASIAEALGQHSPSLLDGGVNLDQVDANQGQKIVGHIFGNNADSVVNSLGTLAPGAAASPLGSGMVQKLLPILAPIVMSYLARQFTSGSAGGGGGGLGGMLGSALGGGLGGAQPGGQGGVGNLLGSVLGGMSGGGQAPGGAGGGGGDIVGNVLSGLLGGGRR